LVDVKEMVDSSHLLDDIEEIRNVLERDGYLLLRNFLDRSKVLTARKVILEFCGNCISTEKGNMMEGYATDPTYSLGLLNYQYLTRQEDVKQVLENEKIFEFWERFFKKPVKAIHYKWLRGVHKNGYTGIHHDRVYLGGGSQQLHTVWIPLGDIPKEQGTLLICKESHKHPGYSALRQKYVYRYLNLINNGWYSEDPEDIAKEFQGEGTVEWVSTDFQAGDVCILGLDVLHMSTTNTTERYRLSCDTRWQPKGDKIEPMLKTLRHSAFTEFNDSD